MASSAFLASSGDNGAASPTAADAIPAAASLTDYNNNLPEHLSESKADLESNISIEISLYLSDIL